MKREPQLPTWARELRERYLAGEASMFLLHGNVREIRRQYATNTYRIEYNGNRVALANALAFTGELVDDTEQEGMHVARIRLPKDGSVNQMLRQLLPAVEVHGVQEEIPRMHDIFIRVVGETTPEAVTAGMTE